MVGQNSVGKDFLVFLSARQALESQAEHLSHVFDRFYRVGKSRSRRAGGGSGIGLTIARALIEAQGGHSCVE